MTKTLRDEFYANCVGNNCGDQYPIEVTYTVDWPEVEIIDIGNHACPTCGAHLLAFAADMAKFEAEVVAEIRDRYRPPTRAEMLEAQADMRLDEMRGK